MTQTQKRRVAVYIGFTVDGEKLIDALAASDSLRALDVSNQFLIHCAGLDGGKTHADADLKGFLELMSRLRKAPAQEGNGGD